MNSCIDHIVIGTANLVTGTNFLETKLGDTFSPGGEHKMMGTHNNLLKLQSEIYLEVIANNLNISNPSLTKWFSLNESVIKEKIKNSPRALSWVLKVDNIEKTISKCGYNPGEIIQISRGKLNWKITVPSSGKLLENGVLPLLIEWPKDQHPSNNLKNNKVSINKLSLFHPEPSKIKNIIFNLIESDLITVKEGVPRIEFILSTQNGQVLID